MPKWLEVLGYLDIVDPIEGFLSTFRYADWEGAYARAGVVGIVDEFFSSLVAVNCWTLWVQRHEGWSGTDAEHLLACYGIPIWGRGFLGERVYFRVKRRQARWAEYILLRCGVPVVGKLFDPRNAEYAKRYLPDSEPPPTRGRAGTVPSWIEEILSLFH